MGLAVRAGAVAMGSASVRDAARADRVGLVIVADDLTDTGRDRLVPLLRSREIPYVVRYDRARLGRAVGRSPLAAVGILDPGFAERLMALLEHG